MSEVKRYGHQQYNGKIWFEEREDGKFCSYDDYAALKAERDTLAAENVALKGFGDTLSEMHAGLESSGTGFSGEHEAACQQIALDSAMDEFDAIKTPATDSYLNSVRAEGVEMWVNQLNGVKGWTVSDAENFAAQLRAGEPS